MQELLRQVRQSMADQVLTQAEKQALAKRLSERKPRLDQLRQLRNHAFDLVLERARAEADGQSMAALIKWLGQITRLLDRAHTQVAVHSEVWFSPGEDCLNAVSNHLRGSRKRVDICVFTIADDRISEEILRAHQRGIAVRVISDDDKRHDSGSDIARLREAGVAVALDRSEAHMHHKFAIFDGRRMLNGSFNWTRSASHSNEENLVSTTDANQIQHFSAQFDSLWRRFADH